MATLPGFFARTYPAFRTARIYRILVGQGGLYFLRTNSLLAASDAGNDTVLQSTATWAISAFIGAVAARGTAEAEELIAREGADALVKGSKHNFFASATEVTTSSLDPAKLFSSSLARWTVKFRDRKPMTLEIESEADLAVAREALAEMLGDRLEIRLKNPS